MSDKNVVEFSRGVSQLSTQETDEVVFQPERRKRPQRVTVAPEDKILVSREEAAQLLSISQRGLDYLVSSRRLPTRRIGGRVLIQPQNFGSTPVTITLNESLARVRQHLFP